MSSGNSAAPKFIKKEFDEFNDRTITTHVKDLTCGGFLSGGGTTNEYTFTLRQVKNKTAELLVLACQLKADDWLYLIDGQLIFNCDQENFPVYFNESKSEAEHVGNRLFCFEIGTYTLSSELLAKICTSKELKLRISGKSGYEVPDANWCLKFQEYCRQFHHDVYDPSFPLSSLPPQGKSNLSTTETVVLLGIGVLVVGALAFYRSTSAPATLDVQRERESTPLATQSLSTGFKPNAATATIIAEATSGLMKDVQGSYFDKTCNQSLDYRVEVVDLNGDGQVEVFSTVLGTCMGGMAGEFMNLYIKDGKGHWRPQFGFPGIYRILETKNRGYPDIEIGGPGFCFPIWRWNGQEYSLYKKCP